MTSETHIPGDAQGLLREILSSPEVRDDLIAALARLVDEEVRRARGLRGSVLRSGYRAVRRMRPGMVPLVVAALLDDWIEGLDPHYTLFLASNRFATFGAYVEARRDAIARILLDVAGERAEQSSNRMARAFFRSLSKSAEADLARAVPRLGAVVERYLAAAG